MNKLYKIAIILFVLISCKHKSDKSSREGVLPYYNDASFTPNWISNNNSELSNFHSIPEFSLLNQDGNIVTDKTFENRIYVTDFFFTSCPGICPKMTSNMALIQDAFKEDPDILLLSHSVTPDIDSITTLKKYAEANGVISNKWHLVTGNRSEIYDLGRNYYFVEEDLGERKSVDDFLHTENFVLVDNNRHIRGIYNGLNKSSINQLIADTKSLKKEL